MNEFGLRYSSIFHSGSQVLGSMSVGSIVGTVIGVFLLEHPRLDWMRLMDMAEGPVAWDPSKGARRWALGGLGRQTFEPKRPSRGIQLDRDSALRRVW